jgi:DNA-binding MarR family transcriptional regulator
MVKYLYHMKKSTSLTNRRHLVELYYAALGRMNAELADDPVSKRWPDLSGSRFRLLMLVPPGGARPSALAAESGVTKQALGQTVAQLEAGGYVEQVPDPADRRAHLVRRTAAGDEVATAASAAVAALERRWRAELGPELHDAFIAALTALGR